MGILLKWKRPSVESNYDTTKVYRSDSQTGTFTEIYSQPIIDTSYYDPEGRNSYWYKIKFYDSVSDIYSSESSATQGSERIGYATVDDVRAITNIKSNQVSDTDLAIMIEYAACSVNNDISTEVYREKVERINDLKLNEIDGENLKFYTQLFPIADANNDFLVNTSDINVYSVDSDGVETELTVTQLNVRTGEFRLQSAPEDVELYVTYRYTDGILLEPPHELIKLACVYLATAMGYSKINVGKAPRFKQGPLTVFRDTTAHKQYMGLYYDTLQRIADMTKAGNITNKV